MIIYGRDLRRYFLAEFGGLIEAAESGTPQTPEQWEAYQAIPFWGEFLS